ncbi:CrcB-like protein-domain-containing protein [Astrocystis sublimbata]|nr:CrcB-like protein-domain-containing protein [Astrocystis sublimbata]
MGSSASPAGPRKPPGASSGPDATCSQRQDDAGEPAHPPSAQSTPRASPTERQLRETGSDDYDAPVSYLNLPEVGDVEDIQDRNELANLDSGSVERLESRLPSHQHDVQQSSSSPATRQQGGRNAPSKPPNATANSKRLTEFYTVSYLVLFAIFGTLARLGLQALTSYPGAPISFSSVWPNFAGTLVIGFLTEDRALFRHEGGGSSSSTETSTQQLAQLKKNDEEAGSPDQKDITEDIAAAKKAHLAVKKTIPLYIGLATGFCGSFTSFSSFIRDIFLALSNDLPGPGGIAAVPRNGGYSFLALLAVTIGTISLSISGFHVGAHLADALAPWTPSIPYRLCRRIIDPLAAFLAWGSWLGAVILSILPPDRYSAPGASEFWRARALFALVFAPLGCLVRFYASARFNSRLARFPLGTFLVNTSGTAILGLAWDIAHVPIGGVVGCQVLQGVEDGFCGCLTTVSTWVLEMKVLSGRRAYVYGGASVVSSLVILIAIMGGLRWSDGFGELRCVH